MLIFSESCKQLRENLKSMKKEVDKIQLDFYNDFRPEVRDSPSATIIIDDYMVSPETIAKLGNFKFNLFVLNYTHFRIFQLIITQLQT